MTIPCILIWSCLIGAVFSTLQIKREGGETVTLHVNKTITKHYLWTFGNVHPVNVIALVTKGEVTHVNGTRFEYRLRTHVETGSMTISNLTVNDSGVFLIQVITETGIEEQRFNLTVDNSLILRNPLEGDNVTLETGVEHLQKNHNVKWTRGPHFSGPLIAQWINGNTFIMESYKGLLQLDPHTGSLNFIGVTKDYTGSYCVKMLLGSEPHILRQYFITVFDPVSVPHVNIAMARSLNNGSCYIICCVENGPDATLSWYRGQRRISNTYIGTNLTLPLVIQHQDGVIYRCEAANNASTRAVTVNSTLWCPSQRPGPGTSPGVIVGILVLVVIVVAVAISCWYSRREEERPDRLLANRFRLYAGISLPPSPPAQLGSALSPIEHPTRFESAGGADIFVSRRLPQRDVMCEQSRS